MSSPATASSSSSGAATVAPASTGQRNPWLWVPSLYFAEGIPYVIVMLTSVVMYKRMGISNTDMALYTSWLYLPWVIKPLWSPFVDITRTKRFWIVSMQLLVAVALALAAVSVRGSGFFKWSLCLFWIMALGSATHDIAADGFYMLGLSKHEQAWWVGLRNTFYQTARIVGSGLLVVLAGVLESQNGLPPLALPVQATAPTAQTQAAAAAAAPLNEAAHWDPAQFQVTAQPGDLHFVVQPAALQIPITDRSADAANALIERAARWNKEHGFLQEESVAPPPSTQPQGASQPSLFSPIGKAWTAVVAYPLETFLRAHFPKPVSAKITPAAGNVGCAFLALSRPPEPGKTLVVTLDRQKHGIEYIGLAKGDKGFRLMGCERLLFNSTNWNQPAMVVIQLDPKLKSSTAVTFMATSGNIPVAWSITLFVVAALTLVFCGWHSLFLPRPASDGAVVTGHSLLKEFFVTLGSFFRKPGIGLTIAFILLYRFDEAQLGRVIPPFLLDAREAGGLGLTTSQYGLAYGTFGILALTCGGLLGGFLTARHGFKTMLPIMVCAMYLPKLVFIFLSYTQPENFLVTCGAIAVEQFGYGFGLCALMLYMLSFADGPHKTAHYALCTGVMALGMMIPGMWSGWLTDLIGYKHFFVWVIFSALPGFTLAMFLKVDPAFGRRTEKA